MRSMMTRSLLLLLTFALLGPLTACGGNDQTLPDEDYTERPSNNAPVAKSIVLYNGAFNPNTLTIPVGSLVIFKNKDAETHNVTIKELGLDSNLKPNTDLSYTFNQRGSFTVVNRLASNPMRATIVVQ